MEVSTQSITVWQPHLFYLSHRQAAGAGQNGEIASLSYLSCN